MTTVPADAPWTAHRARIASLTRSRTPNDPDLLEARRNMRAAKLADHIAKVVDQAPPLTQGQRDRLAAILSGASLAGGDSRAGAA